MHTRYAGKYRRSPNPQTTCVKKKHLTSYGRSTYHYGVDVLASRQDHFFSLLGGRIFLLRETCPPFPPPPLRSLDIGLNIAKT